MNKSDLIEALSAKENLTEKAASDTVNLIFQGFIEAMKKGDRIEIRGFGSYVCQRIRGVHREKPEDRENNRRESQEVAILQGREGTEGEGQFSILRRHADNHLP